MLNPNEIRYNNLIGRWEYCNRCLEVANGLFPDIFIHTSYSKEEEVIKGYEQDYKDDLEASEGNHGGIIEPLEDAGEIVWDPRSEL